MIPEMAAVYSAAIVIVRGVQMILRRMMVNIPENKTVPAQRIGSVRFKLYNFEICPDRNFNGMYSPDT